MKLTLWLEQKLYRKVENLEPLMVHIQKSKEYSGSYSPFTDFSTGEKYYIYSWTASGKFEYFDTFKDPPDLGNWWEKDIEIPGGTPYNYGHIWETASQIKIQGGLIRRPE